MLEVELDFLAGFGEVGCLNGPLALNVAGESKRYLVLIFDSSHGEQLPLF